MLLNASSVIVLGSGTVVSARPDRCSVRPADDRRGSRNEIVVKESGGSGSEFVPETRISGEWRAAVNRIVIEVFERCLPTEIRKAAAAALATDHCLHVQPVDVALPLLEGLGLGNEAVVLIDRAVAADDLIVPGVEKQLVAGSICATDEALAWFDDPLPQQCARPAVVRPVAPSGSGMSL